jgi:hypothetical protein
MDSGVARVVQLEKRKKIVNKFHVASKKGEIYKFKGIVSRYEYFFEGLKNQISTFRICAESF